MPWVSFMLTGSFLGLRFDLRIPRKYTLIEVGLLKVENLAWRRGGTWVLWDVCLEVNEGEIVGILGRSDSGKTSLTRMIAGLEQPTSGTVCLGGQAESDQRPVRPGFAFENCPSAPELTAYENLGLFAALYGIPRSARSKRIAFVMEMLGLSDVRAKAPHTLSGGARARLEIARALLAEAPLTVIDGLADRLDSATFEKLWEYLIDQRRRHARSALITTASGRIAELCDRIAVLSRGRIEYVGRAEDFRLMAGEDVVVLGEMASPFVRNRIEEKLSVVIREEDGFLSFRVSRGEKAVSDLLAEFGSELGCIYLKRPRLEDALDAIDSGRASVTARAGSTQ